MPRRAARRMVGRAALAMTLKKQRTKENLAQMLRQSKNTGLGHLSELMEARVYACVCAVCNLCATLLVLSLSNIPEFIFLCA